MAYKFQLGQAILSGNLDQEGQVDVKNYAGEVKASIGDDGVISGSGNFTLKGDLVMAEVTRVTSAGAATFTAMDADNIKIDGNVISSTNANGNIELTPAGIGEVLIGAGNLNYAGDAVTADGAELNLLDGSSAGTQVASKAVIYDASRGINAHGLTGSLKFSLDAEANGGIGLTPFDNSANVTNLKISGSYIDSTAALALADDAFVGLSASGSVKSFTAAAYATAIAGDGLAASSGVLAVGVDDSSIELNSDALRVKAGGVTDAMLNDDVATGLAGDGLAATSGVMKLDINELSAAAVDVAADSLAIVDADDSNLSRKESIADLVSAMAGGGLTATNGVLSTDAGSVSQSFDGKTLVEGYNYLTGVAGAAKLILPPNPSNGDVVVIKAGNLDPDMTVTISASSTHTIDGSTTIVLESPYSAVSCVLTRTASWSIV